MIREVALAIVFRRDDVARGLRPTWQGCAAHASTRPVGRYVGMAVDLDTKNPWIFLLSLVRQLYFSK